MKKILFITGSYPYSRLSASMLCSHRVIKCVAASGKYDVYVLCVKFPHESKEELINGIHVHRINASIWVRLVNFIKEKRTDSRFDRFESVVRKFMTIPWYPLTFPTTKRLLGKAARVLHSSICFDIVVSEHYGLESLLTGCKLKQNNPSIKHVALLWDPVLGQIPSHFLPSSFTLSRIKRVESIAAKYTSIIVSLPSMSEYYQSHGDIASDKRVYLSHPGVLPPDSEVPTESLKLLKKDAINIVYSGLLSPSQRNPIPVLDLFNRVECASRINIVFFASGARKEVEDYSAVFKGSIVYSEYIPIHEIHTIYMHSDYLLNISNINAKMIPSKVFEYMSYGKPIISAYTTDGDSAKVILDKYPEALSIDLKESCEDNCKDLETFLSDEHLQVPFETVLNTYKNNTPEAYLDIINSLD